MDEFDREDDRFPASHHAAPATQLSAEWEPQTAANPANALSLADEDMLPTVGLPARIVAAVVVLALALVSFFWLADLTSNPETFADTIAQLDEKKETVMGLVAASTAASAAVTLLPGDAGTPIAEKLVDLSSDFLVVIAAIYLEKYLLTIVGFGAFKILVPVAGLLLVVAILMRQHAPGRRALVKLSSKLALFGVAMFLVVPVSVWTSGMIESTYEESINATLAAAEQTTSQIEDAADAVADASTEPNETADSEGEGRLEQLWGFISGAASDAASSVTGFASDLTGQAEESLNGFIEALAIMIVTSCIIPILVLVFFLWLVKVLLGVDVEVPAALLRPRTLRRLK